MWMVTRTYPVLVLSTFYIFYCCFLNAFLADQAIRLGRKHFGSAGTLIDLLRLQQCSYTSTNKNNARTSHNITNKNTHIKNIQKPSYDCWNSPSSQARWNVENASLSYIRSTITRTHVPDAFWCSDVEWKEQHSTARTAAPNSLDFKSWINDYWRSSGIQNIHHWVDERDQYYKQQYNNNDQ